MQDRSQTPKDKEKAKGNYDILLQKEVFSTEKTKISPATTSPGYQSEVKKKLHGRYKSRRREDD